MTSWSRSAASASGSAQRLLDVSKPAPRSARWRAMRSRISSSDGSAVAMNSRRRPSARRARQREAALARARAAADQDQARRPCRRRPSCAVGAEPRQVRDDDHDRDARAADQALVLVAEEQPVLDGAVLGADDDQIVVARARPPRATALERGSNARCRMLGLMSEARKATEIRCSSSSLVARTSDGDVRAARGRRRPPPAGAARSAPPAPARRPSPPRSAAPARPPGATRRCRRPGPGCAGIRRRAPAPS